MPAGQSRYYERRLMDNKKYNPVPVDTSDVVLPEELWHSLRRLPRMFMMFGRWDALQKDGHMVQLRILKRNYTSDGSL